MLLLRVDLRLGDFTGVGCNLVLGNIQCVDDFLLPLAGSKQFPFVFKRLGELARQLFALFVGGEDVVFAVC